MRRSDHLDRSIVSDCDAIDTIYSTHYYVLTVEEVVIVVLHAGTDLDSGQFHLENAQKALDNKESIVLLKNLNRALPLSFDQLQNKKIVLISPTANATVLMQSNYYTE